MAVLKEGTLTKRAVSATFFKTWKERRIVLRSRQNSCAAIGWYRPEETQPAGTLDIDHRTQVSRQGRNLLVRSSGKELYLYHKESALLDEWHDAIAKCVQDQAQQQAPGVAHPCSLRNADTCHTRRYTRTVY